MFSGMVSTNWHLLLIYLPLQLLRRIFFIGKTCKYAGWLPLYLADIRSNWSHNTQTECSKNLLLKITPLAAVIRHFLASCLS